MTIFPLPETERLLLRRFKPDDAAHLFRYRSNPDVARYQGWIPQSEDDAASFIRSQAAVEPDTPGSWFQSGICLKGQGTLIGDLGLHFPADDRHQAEFGISLDPAHHGQGYANETLRAAMSYLFASLGKHRVFCSVDPRNHASVAMARRLGMRQEAHFVKSRWFKGEWVDDVVFGLLKSEWAGQGDDG